MKVTFDSDSPRYSGRILKGIVINLLILMIPVIYDLIYAAGLIKKNYYYFAGTYLFARFIIDCSTGRINQITIDTEQQKIIFTKKSLLTAAKRLMLSFECAKLEISKAKPQRYWLWEPITLIFLQDKMEVADVNISKDGFSSVTLNAICETIKQIPLPIIVR